MTGRPILKEIIDKFKTKQEQLEEAAKEIEREREKDRGRKRLGLTLEEYETTLKETEDPNRVVKFISIEKCEMRYLQTRVSSPVSKNIALCLKHVFQI